MSVLFLDFHSKLLVYDLFLSYSIKDCQWVLVDNYHSYVWFSENVRENNRKFRRKEVEEAIKTKV